MSDRLVLLLAVGMVSVSSVLIRWSTAPPEVLAAYRVALAFFFLTPWVIRLQRRGPRVPRWMEPGDLARSTLAGGFLALHFLLWIMSLSYTSVASSVLLVNLHPLVVLPLAQYLGERITRQQFAGTSLALLGVLVATGGFRSASATGDAMAVGGALMMGLYLITGRRVRAKVPNLLYIWVVYGTAAGILLAWCGGQAIPLFSYSSREFALFAALALIPTIGGHGLLNRSLSSLGASKVSVGVLGEPVGASLLAWGVLGEAPTVTEAAGGGGILLGLLLVLNRDKARKREDRPGMPGVTP